MTMNTTAPGSASPTSALFYDQGAFGAIPVMTKVAGVTVKAAVEIQSTAGGLLLPRMTTAQRVALDPVVDGMQVYDSTLGDVMTRKGAAWVQQDPLANSLHATGTLAAAQINTAYTLGLILIPAPGANKTIVVKGYSLELVSAGVAFTLGGAIALQYTTTAAGAGILVATATAATFLTGAAANRLVYAGGVTPSAAPAASYVNTPICFGVDTANFAVGTGATLNWNIWYSILPAA